MIFGTAAGISIQIPLWSPQRRPRWTMYSWMLVAYGSIVLTLVAAGEVRWFDTLYFLAPFIIAQLVVHSIRIEIRQTFVMGDPARREIEGLPQYGGRSRKYWTVLLGFSLWHVTKYYNYVLSDPESPLREEKPDLPVIPGKARARRNR